VLEVAYEMLKLVFHSGHINLKKMSLAFEQVLSFHLCAVKHL